MANSSRTLNALGLAWPLMLTFCAATFTGCSSAGSPEEGGLASSATTGEAFEQGAVGQLSQAIIPDEALQKTLVPIRSLQVPGKVYLKQIDETIASAGTFTQVIYVYQPDNTRETIRFALSSKTSTGSVDSAQRFESVKVTSRPGQPDATVQTLPNSAGQRVYDVTNSRQGWYRFELSYVAVNAGRTLSFSAYDASNNSLKIAWNDPPKASVQVRAKLNVEQTSQAYLKGGAYRNTDPSQFSYADNVKVDGRFLYRRAFDQGTYDFPLGRLNAGEHTVEFSLAASAYDVAKFWFGVNETSFDPNGVKTAWNRVQFLYYGSMRTGDYDAWSEGVAFAQGATVTNGVRPPPVRRGTTFAISVEDASLSTSQRNARLQVISDETQTEVPWSKALPSGYDYAGGIYVNGAFSAVNREHWQITVPSTAAVGRYYLRATSPFGARIGQDVVFYVIHNPYPLVAANKISKPEVETYGYDEDEDGVEQQGPYGPDQDNLRDHFMAQYEFSAPYLTYHQLTGAFRRTQDPSGLSLLDHAVAATQGTTSELESMRRLYRIVAQRIRYNRQTYQDDISSLLLVDTQLTPEDSRRYAKPNTDLTTTDSIFGGMCYEYGAILTSIARSAGIIARQVSSDSPIGGWGNHVFMEAFIPNVPQHGGTVSSSSTSANSDTDPWYAFDATPPESFGGFEYRYIWPRYSEGIAPRAQYGKAAFVLLGEKVRGVRTTKVDWDPFRSTEGVGENDVLQLASAYGSGPDYWLSRSGITGYLGRGEKEVYRINKAAAGASSVSVRVAAGSSTTLNPKLCIGPYIDPNSPPVEEGSDGSPPRWTASLPQPCSNRATTLALPDGDSIVVVFHDEGYNVDDYVYADNRLKYGDSVQYELTLQ
jgi:hypothetical protein